MCCVYLVSSVSAHSSATLLDSLRELIGNSQLGPPLDELRGLYSAGVLYLMDFVHMVYKPSSDMEHEVSFLHCFHRNIRFLRRIVTFSFVALA